MHYFRPYPIGKYVYIYWFSLRPDLMFVDDVRHHLMCDGYDSHIVMGLMIHYLRPYVLGNDLRPDVLGDDLRPRVLDDASRPRVLDDDIRPLLDDSPLRMNEIHGNHPCDMLGDYPAPMMVHYHGIVNYLRPKIP